MSRVRAVHKPGDYPAPLDATTRHELGELFSALFPSGEPAEIDQSHAGIAIAARSPRLALQLVRLSALLAGELEWSGRRDLWELAVQAVNVHFRCDYSFRARMPAAEAAGVGVELQNALASWPTSDLFDEEQRLVLEYTAAVVNAEVPDALFARVADRFGERGAIEFTAVVAFWSFWAMFLNATGPDLQPETG